MNREGRDPNFEGHLSPEEIAVLAEGQGPGRVSPEAIEHLSRCRSCMAAYADVVRYRAGLLAIPQEFSGGLDIFPHESDRTETTGARGHSAWIPAAAGLIVLVGLAVTWSSVRHEPKRDEGPITGLLERASGEGLVIPGGEAGAASTSPLYRSDAVVDDESERAIEQLRLDYEGGRTGRDVRRLAAALVAAGQLSLAQDYIAEGLARTPSDAQLLTLAAIVAQRRGDLAGAEDRLRKAVDASPQNLTAMLDLGLVIAEARGSERAAPYFKGVIGKVPDSSLARRAQAALAEHGRP